MSKVLSRQELLDIADELELIYDQLYVQAMISGNLIQIIRVRFYLSRLDKIREAINIDMRRQ